MKFRVRICPLSLSSALSSSFPPPLVFHDMGDSPTHSTPCPESRWCSCRRPGKAPWSRPHSRSRRGGRLLPWSQGELGRPAHTWSYCDGVRRDDAKRCWEGERKTLRLFFGHPESLGTSFSSSPSLSFSLLPSLSPLPSPSLTWCWA
jgi:hypothetical protein